MKYNRFEELPVWQDAIELAVLIFDLTSRPMFKGYYTLKDQLERAGVCRFPITLLRGLREGRRRRH